MFQNSDIFVKYPISSSQPPHIDTHFTRNCFPFEGSPFNVARLFRIYSHISGATNNVFGAVFDVNNAHAIFRLHHNKKNRSRKNQILGRKKYMRLALLSMLIWYIWDVEIRILSDVSKITLRNYTIFGCLLRCPFYRFFLADRNKNMSKWNFFVLANRI